MPDGAQHSPPLPPPPPPPLPPPQILLTLAAPKMASLPPRPAQTSSLKVIVYFSINVTLLIQKTSYEGLHYFRFCTNFPPVSYQEKQNGLAAVTLRDLQAVRLKKVTVGQKKQASERLCPQFSIEFCIESILMMARPFTGVSTEKKIASGHTRRLAESLFTTL